MGIMDKFKEIGEEIKNTVEENNLVDKAKGATMILTDAVTEVVGKGKQELENRYNENMQKIEEEKKLIAKLSEDFKNKVVENKGEKALIEGIALDKLMTFTDEFYERIFITRNNCTISDLEFGDYIDPRYLSKSKGKEKEEDDQEEKPLLCYYKNNKDKFLLTTKALYFKGKHLSENYNYSAKINIDDISSILVTKDEEKWFLEINNLKALEVNPEYSLDLQDYFNKVDKNDLEVKDEEVSKIIEDSLTAETVIKIKSHCEEENFLLLVNKANIICTNKQILVLKTDGLEEVEVINKINYNDIAYIGIEKSDDESFINKLSSIFTNRTLEIYLLGNKIKIENVKQVQGDKIIQLVNQYKRNKEENQVRKVIDIESETLAEVKEGDIFSAIRKLSELKDNGIITEDEFQEKKNDLLKRI